MDESGSRRTGDFPFDTQADSPPVFVEVSAGEWERRAVQLGTVAGKAVAVFRQARREWQESGEGAAGKARKAAEVLRREAAARTEEWRKAAMKQRDELRRQAKEGFEKTRERARQVGRDYPLQVVLVAGIAGFVLGAGLRVWRSRRAL